MNINELQSEILKTFPCEGMYGPCGKTPSEIVGCRTQYHDEEMNTSPVMCEQCAKEYNSYWDDMWADYWSDRL